MPSRSRRRSFARALAGQSEPASFLPLAQASSAPLQELYARSANLYTVQADLFCGRRSRFRAASAGPRAMNPFHRAIYLTGPTASGKTAVGVALARRLDAEVVALDSMTLYRGMDIGTAKPTPEERGGVPHHLIDVLDPWESASVADYRSWALAAVAAVEARGNRALFVGGTALYLKALLRGLFAGPGADPARRQA